MVEPLAQELAQLLEQATLMPPSAATAQQRPQRIGSAAAPSKFNLQSAEHMLRFLIDKKLLDPSAYGEWFEMAVALKNTGGEAAFELFDRLSSEASKYDAAACREKWVRLEQLPDSEARLTLATFFQRAEQAGYSGQQSETGSTNFRKMEPAAAAIQLAEEAGDELWLDQHDKPHASYFEAVEGERVQRHTALERQVYRRLLGKRFNEAVPGKTLTDGQARSAVDVLIHKAENGPRHVSSLRAAEHDGHIYVDLGRADGLTVKVGPEGWQMVKNPPVRFVRGSRGELPIPEPGGTLDHFRRHFQLPDQDLLKLIAFMVGTFNDAGSFPILLLVGEQASGKSMKGDMVLACTDPPSSPKGARLSFTPDEKDFHINAQGARVLYFDNVSSFPPAAADALCRMATGAGSQSRKLYTDNEENRLVVIRPVMVTCIGLPSTRPDLLSRALRVNAPPIERRRSETVVWREFDQDQPKLLGFLMTCLSAALTHRASIEAAVESGELILPRMADFASFVEGCAHLLGLKRGDLCAILAEEQLQMQVQAAQDHPVGAGLIAYFAKGGTAFEGPARDLLAVVRAHLPDGTQLPAANRIGNELSRIAPGLRDLGIDFLRIEAGGHDNVQRYRVWTTERHPEPNDHDAQEPDPF